MSLRSLVIFIYFFCSILYAQKKERKLIIYAESNDYLLPMIEKELMQVSFYENKDLIYLKVNNLNYINSGIFGEKQINNAIKYLSGVNLSLDDSARFIKDKVTAEILQNNLFLKVKINELNNLLEFQFALYEIVGKNISINTSNQKAAVDIFIDIQHDDYGRKIKDAIKTLFPLSNKPPFALIEVVDYIQYKEGLDEELFYKHMLSEGRDTLYNSYFKIKARYDSLRFIYERYEQIQNDSKIKDIDKNFVLEKLYENRGKLDNGNLDSVYNSVFKGFDKYFVAKRKKYYLPVGETVVFSPYNSMDVDTPREQLIYSWKVIERSRSILPPDFVLELKNNLCLINFKTPSEYFLELSVSDGVTVAKDTIEINLIRRKILYIRPQNRQHLMLRQNVFINSGKVRTDPFEHKDVFLNVYTLDTKEINAQYLILESVKTVAFDTAYLLKNYNGFKNITLSRNNDSKDKVGSSLFGVKDESTLKLTFSHSAKFEGVYRVLYFDRGIKVYSNLISVNNIKNGAMSLSFLWNSARIRSVDTLVFTHPEILLEGRVLKNYSLYISSLINLSKIKIGSNLILGSLELGAKGFLSYPYSSYRKSIFEVPFGLFMKRIIVDNKVGGNSKSLLGLSLGFQYSFNFYKRLNLKLQVGRRIGYQIFPYFNKDFSEENYFLGIGVNFM